ncbi:uncharacterized protein LOC124807875 [Hydra vulgaris]|uniref:uncharacterized protein LOC124807875 n=1 Tax=Hydra vulgaris TaxID=6087 RepID=UPI001F5EEB98|nr:uncharacterized protein LOC124807875 [Hydra vulgaris]
MCSIGLMTSDACEGQQDVIETLSNEEKIIISLRCNIELSNLEILCERHNTKYLKMYPIWQKACCDPFNRHTKKITKNLGVVTIKESQVMMRNCLNIPPGKKLCKPCKQKIARKKELTEEEQSKSEQDEDFLISPCKKIRQEINKELKNFSLSPLKSHSKSLKHILSEGKQKVACINEMAYNATRKIETQFSSKLCYETNGMKKKAANFDEIMSLVKEKILCSDKRTIVQLLTLAPPSWSILEVQNNFSVTEYQAKMARKIFNKKGLLGISPLYKGKVLHKEIEDSVKLFYDSSDLCRTMPGKKDYVSIQKNVHKQKKLLLCNLKELYVLYKENNPEIQISYSKFASLRPKWCILPGASGTHSVCVCSYHQNAILLVDALNIELTYKDLLLKTVCSVENKECMLAQCDNCPGKELLTMYLYEIFGEYEDDFEIHYKQWQTTDRATLLSLTTDVPTFIELLVSCFEKLQSHSYIAKSQSQYLNQLKENMDQSNIIILGDFAENYAFVVQDEIQSYHWNTQQCSLHPLVIYYKEENGVVKHISYCFISDDITHDVTYVYKIFQLIIPILKTKFLDLSKLHLFTDGCAGQYKNCKSFYNLCQLETEFSLKIEWNFFATSHGKSPCDGIGGTVKRLTAQESLKRPYRNQILTSEAMYEFCVEKIKAVNFIYIKGLDLQLQREKQKERYTDVTTLPGTRSFHQFIHLGDNRVGAKRCSTDTKYTIIHNLKKKHIFEPDTVTLGGYVAVVYDDKWWIGIVTEINLEEVDAEVKFLHPRGPSIYFNWPERDDHCFIPNINILKKLSVPQACSSSGRNYVFENVEIEEVQVKWQQYCELLQIQSK